MSDSNQDQDRDPRFTRALLGRILAVGMFVALGSFAVIQMMSGKGNLEGTEVNPGTVTQNTNTSPSANGDTEAVVDNDVKVKTPIGKIQTASVFNSGSIPPSAPPSKNAFTSNSFQSKPDSNTFQPAKPPTRNSFEPIKPFVPGAPPVVTASKPPSSPQVQGKPPSSPPTRYAQLPDQGIPVIGNNNGFGTRSTTPPTNGFPQTIKDVSVDAKDAADKLLNESKQASENVLNKLQDKIPTLDIKRSPLAGTNLAKSQYSKPKSFEPPPLRPQSPPTNGNVVPTMQAPKPETKAFDPQAFGAIKSPVAERNPGQFSNLQGSPLDSNPQAETRPHSADKRFGQNNSFANSSAFSQSPSNSRLQSFPAKSPEQSKPSNVQSRSSFADLNKLKAPQNHVQNTGSNNNRPVLDRRRLPAMPATNSRSLSASQDRIASNPRTTNIPGDRELEGVQAPALTVEKLSPREIQVNQPAEFEIVVRNVGRVNADDVQVHDQIPAGTEFQGSTPEPTNVTADRRINWEIGSLRSGQEKRIKLQLKPIQPGEIGSVAHVTFSTQASMRTLVTKPVLEIIHQSKPEVLIGDDVIFDVVVQNKGDGAAKNVLIQEDVPPQLEYQGGFRELEYEIGTLMPGQSKRIQLGLKAAQIGKLKNLIFASATGGLRAQHEIDMEVISPRLVTKSSGPTRRYLQREVTHQFSVVNQGTATATNVDLIARLPAGLKFVGADNRGRYDASSHSVFWSLAELGLGVNAGVELVSMPVDVGNQDIKFEAVADLNQKSATRQELAVEHLVDVFFDIDDVVDPIEIGSDTSYRIKVVNQGTQAAANVQLQLEFPNGLVPTGVDGNLQNQIQGQRILFAPISSLNPGDQLQLIVAARGQAAGDHRVILNMQADGRQTPVSKEETTRVYADR